MKPAAAKSKNAKPADSLAGDADTSRKLQQLAIELESGLRTRSRRSASQTSRASSRSGRSPSAALVEAKAEELRAARAANRLASRHSETGAVSAAAPSRLSASRARTPSFSDPSGSTPNHARRPLRDTQRSAIQPGQPKNAKSAGDQCEITASHKPEERYPDRSSLSSIRSDAHSRKEPRRGQGVATVFVCTCECVCVCERVSDCETMQGAAGSPQFCCQRRRLWILREADWDANLCTCRCFCLCFCK